MTHEITPVFCGVISLIRPGGTSPVGPVLTTPSFEMGNSKITIVFKEKSQIDDLFIDYFNFPTVRLAMAWH